MRRKLVPLLAALLLAVPVSGCLGIGGEDTSEQAKRVQEAALQSMQSTDTNRFNMSMSVESSDQRLSMHAEGAIDRSERKLRMNMSMSGAVNRDVTVYFDNETAYQNAGTGWATRDISDRDVWNSRDQLARQQELLNASTVRLVGNDTVDGTAVRVLELSPDEGELRDLVAQQTQSNLEGVSMENVTFLYYVGTDDSQLHRVEMDATMIADGTAGSVSMTLEFSDFGSDVSIEIPDEATNATA